MGQLGDLREIIVIAKHIAIPQKRTKHELPCVIMYQACRGRWLEVFEEIILTAGTNEMQGCPFML